MVDHGCTILLDHNQIEAFYESVRNPDVEELCRRDRFFEEIERESPLHIEGTDIVSTIPDIDIGALMSETEAYAPVRNIPMMFSFSETAGKAHGAVYSVELAKNIAA